jgi:hypothetical protein
MEQDKIIGANCFIMYVHAANAAPFKYFSWLHSDYYGIHIHDVQNMFREQRKGFFRRQHGYTCSLVFQNE